MSNKTEKALNEKLNVKLPENLSKDSILMQLENVQQNEKIVEIPKKKNTAKRIIPIAASLTLVIGLLGAYFGMGLGEKTNGPAYSDDSVGSDKIEVMRYQSYDKIYDKFDALRKEYEKENKSNFLVDVFNYASNGAVAENMAGDMAWGDSDNATLPEDSNEESLLSGIGENTVTSGSSNTETNEQKKHGTTNTQEEGVDEGDIIKTDGNYLYIANADSQSISIVDVTGEEMTVSAEICVEEKEVVQELYINGDKLIVVGFIHENAPVAYKYDGYYSYISSDTFVKVYDIGDRTAPKLVIEYSQQGGYDNSRMIGTKLYCISTYFVDVSDDYYRDKCIPETAVNGVCEKIAADCISVVEGSESATYAVVTTIDVENVTEPSSEAILGNCDELYASAKGLFISETDYYSESYNYQQTTKIYRFEYTDTGVDYKCMGRVAGCINDQFSMSYDGEYFRIATTVDKTVTYDENGKAVEVQLYGEDGWRNKDLDGVFIDNVTMNNLYILNNNMQIVGSVEDLAAGETIKSVRFVGNMAYVVTFRQTDPLFVIDLSDPENPTVKGELKIPGFSEYLHPIADGLLIGVGQDGTEFGTNGDCKVSLFDVTNPYEPKETSIVRVSNGEAYCWTPVSTNHKTYITLADNEFAVPFTMNWYSNTGREHMSGDYYIRYRLTGDGLCEVARYEIGGDESTVMSATYIENTFYVIINSYGSGTFVIAYDLTTNEKIGEIKTAAWE